MSTITYIVKVASGKFTIDGAVAPKLTFRDGDTYVFDQSDASNSGHILQFSATSNNSGSSEYTTGVTKTGTAGQANAQTQIITSSSTTDTLYYYSSGGGEHGREFSNSGFNTSANYNVLKPIVGSSSTAEKWGAMVNHAIDQIDLQAKDNRDYTDQHAFQGEPHIIPDVLYPAWSGLIDNHTGHTFTDSSADARTVTAGGNVHHSGKASKVGSTSISVELEDDSIQVTDHADFDNGTSGEFTWEFWFNLSEIESSPGTQYLFSFGDSVLRLTWEKSNNRWYFNAGGNDYTSYTTAPVVNTWYHCAIVGTSSTVKVYFDGTERMSVARHGSNAINPSAITLGAYNSTSYSLHGFMDEIRYSKLAVYTGAFTAPTSALTTTWSAGTNIAANSTASNVKLLIHSDNGGHVGAYGTEQSDGRKYYYTDIKGSKPIKDPRIGGHFGSQRHKFKSLQLLEQETATHGKNVYSVDGREWIRGVGGWSHWSDAQTSGGIISGTQNDFIEITGYFSSANYIAYTDTNDRSVRVTIDGGTESGTSIGGAGGSGSPLGGRYVDSGSMLQLTSTTLGIHTIKIRKQGTASTTAVNGIELIAQDTTSTATKSQIQIPSQNVVSYGKKFTVSATAQHYDPFNGFTNETDNHNTYIDYATSLGTDGWKNGSNYYRPYNGGRVVKWVDSSGTIKTSVNMMPPNARSIGNSSSLTNATAKANASIANNTFYPTMEAGTVDHSLAEVAKTFHFREFGNGSANAGTGGSYKDATMLTDSGAQDMAYVMDDGLTALWGDDVRVSAGKDLIGNAGNSNDIYYITFIGTGVSIRVTSNAQLTNNVAQNLPYGTHILKCERGIGADNGNSNYTIDGIALPTIADSTYSACYEITFHQPKMPPIPEDAVIIADYMLMAEFKGQGAEGIQYIAKGVRFCANSRDIFYNPANNTSAAFNQNHSFLGGYEYWNNAANLNIGLYAFGSNYNAQLRDATARSKLVVDGTTQTSGTTLASGSDKGGYGYLNSDITLGVHKFGHINNSGSNGAFSGYSIASPIHTSSHYQSFETPFLHELVGGDRNMEQTNLVVTPDGKSWDEETRDTSYIRNVVLQTNTNVATNWSTAIPFIYWRGADQAKDYFNKDFAIAYNRIICLVDGWYEMFAYGGKSDSTTGHLEISVNGVANTLFLSDSGSPMVCQSTNYLKRGDYVQVQGEFGVQTATRYSIVYFKRLEK